MTESSGADLSDHLPHYAAFLSYQSGSIRAARRLEHDLYGIAKRHNRGAQFRLFLDVSDLRPGSLTAEIRTVLEQSRFLVVLLDVGTATSTWVAEEIRYWLSTTGHPDRLILIRVGDVDLAWDSTTGDFAVPAVVPEPLRGLFDEEQKWIEYTRWSPWRDPTTLAGLCARLMDVRAAEFLAEEVRSQRHRTRRLGVLASTMALMLVAVVVAGVVAVVNQQLAEQNEVEARAQADAAEALLAADNAPTLAIEQALQAAKASDSPTVRSAMLAVSQGAARLDRALVYPESETGAPPTDLRFVDNGRLLAWGSGREEGTTAVVHWDVASGIRRPSTTVRATGLVDLAEVGTDHWVACSDTGPILFEVHTATTRKLEKTWHAMRSCRVHLFESGAVLLTDTSAHIVDYRGNVHFVDRVTRVVTRTTSRAIAMSGPGRASIMVAGKIWDLPVPHGLSVEAMDSTGAFLFRNTAASWVVAAPADDGYSIQTIVLPNDAVESAPLLNLGRFTGDLVWIAADGTVGWTRNDHRTRITSHNFWTSNDGARMESLGSDEVIAVYRGAVVVLHPPLGTRPGSPLFGNQRGNWDTDWAQASITSINTDQTGRDRVLEQCPTEDAVLIPSQSREGTQLLVDGDHDVVPIGRGKFTPSCDLLDVAGPLVIHPRFSPTVTLRKLPHADAVSVAPDGRRVAILNTGFPIEVLSTRDEKELHKPWEVISDNKSNGVVAVAAFGARELAITGDELVITEPGAGSVERLKLPHEAEIVTPSPDGAGAIVSAPKARKVSIVNRGDSQEGIERCSNGPLRYVPGAQYRESLQDAENPVPVGGDERATVDCRDARPVANPPDVLSYDIGTAAGRIVVRHEGEVEITTWTRDDPSSLRSFEGPPLSSGDRVSLAPDTRTALVYAAGGRVMRLYRRDDDQWTPTAQLVSAIGPLHTAELADGGSLVLAIGSGNNGHPGGFQLFDTDTARLVATDPTVPTSGLISVQSRRAGDLLSVHLEGPGATGATSILIPVSVPALRRQLCSIYATEQCN